MRNTRQSVVNKEMIFNTETWVISVLNTGGAIESIVGGHAMILIEGMKQGPKMNATLFVGHYDILAVSTADQNTDIKDMINTKGYITTVRCYDEKGYTREHYNYTAKSWPITPDEAATIIDSIKQDKAICEAAARGEGEYPRYQKLGTQSVFSEIGMGESCSSWCANKLAVANIEVNGKKPAKAAGGCVIL